MDLKEVKIWNVKYNLLTAREIADVVKLWLKEGRKGIHLTGADAYVTVLAQEDELLRKAILESDIVNVDSFFPTKMLSMKGYDIKERVTTPDLMEELLKDANENGKKVYLLGAKEETLHALIENIMADYSNLKIVGSRNGYYTDAEEDEIAQEISNLAPDYLFIGMPSPRKEHFILKYKHTIDVGVFLGVGGAFDARANVLKRPPTFLRGHGLEAFFRVLRKPRVYGKRLWVFIDYFKMLIKDNKDNIIK